MSYCTYVNALEPGTVNIHRHYHDNLYGFPIADDNELFGRLILEINQAGLSWSTILQKEQHFRKAYAHFNIQTIAAFDDADIIRLLQDTGIIRNRLKVQAAITNAQIIMTLQKEHGTWKAWLDHHHPKTEEEWVKLFKKTFKFTGGEITNEFLMSTGYLPGAHDADCPIYAKTVKAKPAWLSL
jgi:DNA-3-methyladenine glycosylase I